MESPDERPFLTWGVGGSTFSLDYKQEVLFNIAMSAMESFCALPYGGLETGGVMLGTFEEGVVRITGSVPFLCNHTNGPWFTLSETEQRQFGEIVSEAVQRMGLKPVGWYRSVKQRQVRLGATDVEIHRRFFPEPWQVVLILQPSASSQMRAGFFHRNPEGNLKTDAAPWLFSIETMAGEEDEAQQAGAAAPHLAAAAPDPAPSSAPDAGVDEPDQGTRGRSRRGGWLSRLRPSRTSELTVGDEPGNGPASAARQTERREVTPKAAEGNGRQNAELEPAGAGKARIAELKAELARMKTQLEAERVRAKVAEGEAAALRKKAAEASSLMKQATAVEKALTADTEERDRAAAAEAARLRERGAALEQALAAEKDARTHADSELARLREQMEAGVVRAAAEVAAVRREGEAALAAVVAETASLR